LLISERMTRRRQLESQPARSRRSAAPAPRVARGPAITSLGFAFFRLVPLRVRERGELPFGVLRLGEAQSKMAAFALMG
jgi:hypothetical protein